MDDWETLADDPAPVVIPAKSINANKWEGEDEEEDVKDSWEDEEEEEKPADNDEKKDVEKAAVVVKTKPKKNLYKKIAEKEQLDDDDELLTEEQKLSEKLRLQKVQEEADLRVAMDTFGVTDSDLVARGGGVIDNAKPTNREELETFREDLVKKILQFKSVDGFSGFIEALVQGVSVTLSSAEMQKIKKSVDNLYTEKQKLEKEKSKKGATKGKAKASLRMEGSNAKIQSYDTFDTGDYDDFM